MDPHWRRTRIALLKQVLVPMALVALAGAWALPRYGGTFVAGSVETWPFTAALPLVVLGFVANRLAERGLVGATAHAGNRGGASTGPWLFVATWLAAIAAILLGIGLFDVYAAWR